MNLHNRIAVFFSAVLPFLGVQDLFSQNAVAQSVTEEPAAALRSDIEFDPTPYLEHGYSFHVGIGRSHFRLEGEVLRTDVPEWIHGNKGFDVSYQGGGAKLQYFFSPKQQGAFVGARSEIARESIRLHRASLEARPMRHDFGIDAGYRFVLGRHLYVTPWGGVDYTFDAHSLKIAGRTYNEGRFGVFAAVHFGWRL
jgi:hypothetical protein